MTDPQRELESRVQAAESALAALARTPPPPDVRLPADARGLIAFRRECGLPDGPASPEQIKAAARAAGDRLTDALLERLRRATDQAERGLRGAAEAVADATRAALAQTEAALPDMAARGEAGVIDPETVTVARSDLGLRIVALCNLPPAHWLRTLLPAAECWQSRYVGPCLVLPERGRWFSAEAVIQATTEARADQRRDEEWSRQTAEEIARKAEAEAREAALPPLEKRVRELERALAGRP